MSSDRYDAAALHELTDEQLEAIAHDAAQEYADGVREAAARLLFSRLTVVVAPTDAGRLVMPKICALCGNAPVAGKSEVSGSYGGGDTAAVTLELPLCGGCKQPLDRLDRATDTGLMNALRLVALIAGVGVLVSLVLVFFVDLSLAWLATFAISAVVALVAMRAIEYAVSLRWSSDERAALERAKRPAGVIHMGHEVHITFLNVAFAASVRTLNGERLRSP